MNKIVNIFTLVNLLIHYSTPTFNTSAAQCLVQLLYGGLDINSMKDTDYFLVRLKKIIINKHEDLNYQDFADQTIIKDITNLFTYYKSLSKDLQEKMARCNLKSERDNLMEKCKWETGKPCSFGKGDLFSVYPKCQTGFESLYNVDTCYPECPAKKELLNEKEPAYKCRKESVMILKPYSSEIVCTKNKDSQECVQLPQGFWVRECGPNHERVLIFLCLPKCPPTWINDRKYCLKKTSKPIGQSFFNNFYDLISVKK